MFEMEEEDVGELKGKTFPRSLRRREPIEEEASDFLRFSIPDTACLLNQLCLLWGS
jgi:hypothetical protein